MHPGPIDGNIDGTIGGLTGNKITDTTYEYGVDYLGHFLRQAAEKWNARFDGDFLDSVNIIAHSTGGLVARSYIQSEAYGDSFTSSSSETLQLPEIENLIMIGVPNQGASKAWNPIHDQWIENRTYKKVFSKVINAAYQKVLQGEEITGPIDGTLLNQGTISLTSILSEGEPDPIEFIKLYVPTLNSLLATYDFLDKGNGTLINVNNNLDLLNNYPDSGNPFLLDLNAGLNQLSSPGDSNAFADLVTNTVAIYGISEETATTVTQQVGETNLFWDERFKFTDSQPVDAEDGEIWYEDNSLENNGDGTVPLESSRGQFIDDTRVQLRGFTSSNDTNSNISNEVIISSNDGVDHGELVSNVDVQTLIFRKI